MSPLELQTRIQEELWEEDGLDASHIRVTVQGRDVWLEGTVPTPAMYDLAERIVAQINDVGDLTNALTCTDEAYDIRSHRDGIDLRADPSTDLTQSGRLAARIGPFGTEWDEASEVEGEGTGGPVGGDTGEPEHPTDFTEAAPMASDLLHTDTPWRYQTKGTNAGIGADAVLPPEDEEV